MRHILLTILLLLCSLACTSGDSGKVRPPGESFAVAAPAPDTAPSAPPAQVAPAVKKLSRPAQRAWDTAAPESFDVEEVNRRNQELMQKTKSTTIDTIRIKPTEFPGLPGKIANWLEERKYTIPQSMFKKYSNVISGSYMSRGQQDIAVLAMRDAFMDVLVFEKSTTDSVHTLIKDAPGLWGLELLYHSVPDSTVRLLYSIEPFGTDLIQYFYETFDWPEPPEIAHQAVWYCLLEESSIIFYYHNGEWLRLERAD